MRFDGDIYDTGSKLGFLTANVAYAWSDPTLKDAFRAEAKRLLG